MITVRRFQEKDIELIEPRREFKADPSMNEWLYLASAGQTFTMVNHIDWPVMILGCNLLWKGVAQVWTVPTEAIRGQGLYVVKFTKALMWGLAIKHRIRRMHCIIHSQLTENVRWIELLGFTREGVMRKATPDGFDMYIYVKWFDQTLEDYHEFRTEKGRSRFQRDVEKLLGLDAGRASSGSPDYVKREGQVSDAWSEARFNRVEPRAGKYASDSG